MQNLFAKARFEGYKTQPGQIQLRMPGEIEVELFKDHGDTWKVRALPTLGVYPGIEGPPEYVQRSIAERFEKQTQAWTWVDEHGSGAESPSEMAITHAVGERHMQSGLMPSVKRTMCGKIVRKGRIVPASEAKCDQCRIVVGDQKTAKNAVCSGRPPESNKP